MNDQPDRKLSDEEMQTVMQAKAARDAARAAQAFAERIIEDFSENTVAGGFLSPLPPPPEPRIRIENGVVFLDGKPIPLPDDECVDLMRELIQRRGTPFPASHHDMRVDRIKKRLPKELQAVIKTKADPGTFIPHDYF